MTNDYETLYIKLESIWDHKMHECCILYSVIFQLSMVYATFYLKHLHCCYFVKDVWQDLFSFAIIDRTSLVFGTSYLYLYLVTSTKSFQRRHFLWYMYILKYLRRQKKHMLNYNYISTKEWCFRLCCFDGWCVWNFAWLKLVVRLRKGLIYFAIGTVVVSKFLVVTPDRI